MREAIAANAARGRAGGDRREVFEWTGTPEGGLGTVPKDRHRKRREEKLGIVRALVLRFFARFEMIRLDVLAELDPEVCHVRVGLVDGALIKHSGREKSKLD